MYTKATIITQFTQLITKIAQRQKINRNKWDSNLSATKGQEKNIQNSKKIHLSSSHVESRGVVLVRCYTSEKKHRCFFFGTGVLKHRKKFLHRHRCFSAPRLVFFPAPVFFRTGLGVFSSTGVFPHRSHQHQHRCHQHQHRPT